MLISTDAIVLALTPHSDRAMILSVYTRERGRQNYMVYGAGARRKSRAQFAPMTRITLTVDEQPTREMQTLRQAEMRMVPEQLTTDIRRQTVALFIAELLYRTIRHPMEDDTLFQLIDHTAEALERSDEPENIHLQFLAEFCSVMGFAINPAHHPDLIRMPHTQNERRQQLHAYCTYLREHVEDWVEPKSLDVLMTVFA